MSVLISVIIPVYNGCQYIEQAINSVFKQDYTNLEIIVIDDGSTDNIGEVIKDFQDRVTYVYQDNSGPSIARNRGLEIARGKIITFLDSDDLWSENKLKVQLEYLNKNPTADVIIGRTLFFDDDNNKNEEPIIFLNLGSAIFRREVFDKVGVFDRTLRYSEDVDWFNRARECNIAIFQHPEVVLFYRQHRDNMTKNKTAGDLNILKVLKKSLDRRRDQNNGSTPSLPDFTRQNYE